MTVAELIEQLKGIPRQDLEVWVARDAEGNGFNPLYEAAVEEIDEDRELDPDGELRLVLWP